MATGTRARTRIEGRSTASPFGAALKEWRARRRLSQLDLSLAASVSARHIAFLETGRARPSRAMAMQLGEALGMPRAERNRLLEAAGYRAAWASRQLDTAEMAPVRHAIDRVIARHDPWPAFVLDRHWNVQAANRSGTAVLAAFGVAADGGESSSLLDALTEPGRVQGMIDNWAEVAAHLLARLRTESTHLGGDAVLDTAAARLAADPALAQSPLRPPVHGEMPPVIPARYRIGEQLFSVFTTIAQFGTAEDIALADLRIEMLFPADKATETLFEMLA